MHLNDRQLDRFFDLLDNLIMFANSRLHLVKGLSLPIVGSEAEMKAAYVCDSMWRHIEVIDEYVRLNPNGLRPSDLQAVAAWRDVLFGQFKLVRFENGRAVLMNEAGLFGVVGLDEDPQKRMSQCPDTLVTSLLPFEGLIISDGLMVGDGIPFNEAEMAQMNAELEEHASEGVAWTADELVLRARAYNEHMRELEFDELMSSIELEGRQAREGERLPEGYHRGVLAGLPADERGRLVREHSDALGHDVMMRTIKEQAADAEPSDSLEDCLALCLKRDELVQLCKALAVKRYGSKNKRAIAGMLVGPLTQARQEMENDLRSCNAREFELFCRVVQEGGRCEDELSELVLENLSMPVEPYVFQFVHGSKLVSVLPEELRPLAGSLDLEALSYDRSREDAALNCVETMGEYYGLLNLREAYELYRAAVVDAYALEDFIALLMREDAYDDMGFVLQEWNGDSYLMHYSISDAHVRDLVVQRNEEELEGKVATLLLEGLSGPTMTRLYRKVQDEFQAEVQELDRYRKHVLEVRSRTPRRPLDPAAAEGKTYDRYLEMPALVQLRDFYDAHVPDGEDDFTFAERAVEDLVLHAIDVGNVDVYLDSIEQSGWDRCAEDPHLMPRLVENAYGALPSWEFNGWSPQEVLERMSGRKVFYNVRGEMLHPGPGETCPCGSGKPYGECHGKG